MNIEDGQDTDDRLRSAARTTDDGSFDVEAEWQRLRQSLDGDVRRLSPAGRRGWVVPTAAAAACTLAVAGIAVGAAELHQHPVASNAPAVGGVDQPCTLAPGAGGTAWPSEVRWQRVGAVATPFSAAYGPQRVDPDGTARCFAHSRLGAVFSSIHLIVDSGASDIRGRLTGPGAASATASDLSRTKGPSVALVGYQVVLWQTSTAIINIALRNDDGTIGVVTLTQLWDPSRHDWLTYADKQGVVVTALKYPEKLVGYVTIPAPPDAGSTSPSVVVTLASSGPSGDQESPAPPVGTVSGPAVNTPPPSDTPPASVPHTIATQGASVPSQSPPPTVSTISRPDRQTPPPTSTPPASVPTEVVSVPAH